MSVRPQLLVNKQALAGSTKFTVQPLNDR